MATAKDVASWMLAQARARPRLYQETAVIEIRTLFGDEFVYRNHNFNWAISQNVLKEFRKVASDFVWNRSDKSWRPRDSRRIAHGSQQE